MKTLVLCACLLSSSLASAQTVTFACNDAAPGKFFSAPLSTVAGNVLYVGLDSGFDATLWKYRDFSASGLAYHYAEAADTLACTVTAPAGFVITSISYSENTPLGASRTGRPYAVTLLTVNGIALPGKSAAPNTKVATVSIFTSLVSSSAAVQVLGAQLVVTVGPQ